MTDLKYDFKNKELLDLALTQSGADATHNNERLEFVGDRVLGLTVATMLYEMFPNESEGELARRHAMLVSTNTLWRVACQVGLDKHVRHGHMTAGRIQHILADTMEAVLGAIFLDGGFDAARRIISQLWHDLALADATHPRIQKPHYKNSFKNLIMVHYRYMSIWMQLARRTVLCFGFVLRQWGNLPWGRGHPKSQPVLPPHKNC